MKPISRNNQQSSKTNLKKLLARNPFPRPLTLGFFYREKMRAIHRVAPDCRIVNALEIGGGEGGLTALVYPESKVFNIDFEIAFGKAACNRENNVTFICGDATALPFPDDFFDAVTLFDVLEHIGDDKRAITESLRVLKKGGFLLLSTPNKNWRYPYYRALKTFCPEEEDLMKEWGHVRRGYTGEELNRLVEFNYQKSATFINALTALTHDVSFSKLPEPLRVIICVLLSPITWIGYLLHRPDAGGTETAYAWEKR